jgi:hypothetical protein
MLCTVEYQLVSVGQVAGVALGSGAVRPGSDGLGVGVGTGVGMGVGETLTTGPPGETGVGALHATQIAAAPAQP